MMQNSRVIRHLCPLLAILMIQAKADSFVLRDGSTVDGKIVRETENSYVVEVQVSRSIKDERVLLKSDVQSQKATKEDLLDFKQVFDLLPTPDFLTLKDYASRIAVAEGFLAKHPTSSKVKQANAILGILNDEMAKIKDGGVKVKGRILTAVEYRADMLDIDAAVQNIRIRNLIRDGQLIAALREFEAFERDFAKTKASFSLRPIMRQVIELHVTQMAEQLESYDQRFKDREHGLERMQPDDSRRAQAAILEETDGLNAHFKAEKDAKISWVTPHPFHKPSMEDNITLGKREAARLAVPTPLIEADAGAVYRDLFNQIIKKEDPAAITASLADAKKNAVLSVRYLDILEAEAGKQQ